MPYIDFNQLVELETQCQSTTKFVWRSAALSDVGRVREVNEDAFYNDSEQGLWAVADGMGGLARGDYASGVVVDAFVHYIKASTIAGCIRDIEVRLREAHANCRNSFKSKGERVGSTVAALYYYGGYGFLLWAGDSRVYRLRNKQLQLLTRDHTVAQDKIASGAMTPQQAARHPSAHVLTRAVGVHQTLHLDLDFDLVQAGDRFLVCSDGLYNELPEDELQSLLTATEAQQAVKNLVNKALNQGGRDNITAIVVDAVVDDTTPDKTV
ncbi:MAG: serine/threonine phosphatase PppA [Candidatus Pelagadaptatus aseana]|uniref:PP2C family protein-serine/threonine phosphatase n=1 Tax=Candidatus Pelagadaptatus aseana TaxID=3120508 RepID=UPI0039B2BB08